MTTIEVVGDIIEYDGRHMARIHPTHKGTILEGFKEALGGRQAKVHIHGVLDDVLREAKKIAKVGMITLEELETIIQDQKNG